MTEIRLNAAYFAINFIAVLLIFHRFLRQRFFGRGFWTFVEAGLLGFAIYYFGTEAVRFAVERLGGSLTLYNNNTVAEMIGANRYIMLAVSVVLAPVIEETLIRGLVFGSVRAASLVMAYIVSIVLFCLMHNWQYFGFYPTASVLLSCLAYVPASFALAWSYQKSGTIWCPIALHAVINALSFGALTLPK
jgi:membrane protease YdiL (CAAX protease family)